MKNLDKGEFTIAELVESFSSQSAYFLNMYSHMNKDDRFLKYVGDLVKKDHFKLIFPNYHDYSVLCNHYNRKVFHNHLDCENMKRDFESEREFHRNTGVFGREDETKLKYYSLPEPYLLALGMRQCNNCYDLDVTAIPFEEIWKITEAGPISKRKK